MKSVKKYAIRFPGLELDSFRTQESPNIFSENRIIEMQQTFSSVLNAAESLAEFIVQKNKTNELGKRISAQKEALDAEIKSKTEQERIQYVEESKRLKIKLENEKKEMELEFQRLMMETAEQAKELDFSFKKFMQTNPILHNIVLREKKLIEDIQPYIGKLADDYSNRREYMKYCEIERKSLELINKYLNQMI